MDRHDPKHVSRRLEILLEEKPFFGMVLSAVEVFKKECVGVLCGTRGLDRVVVEAAVPFQAAERWHDGVRVSHRRSQKLYDVLSAFPSIQLIGDYHSHPGWGDGRGGITPSRIDIRDMEMGRIHFIMELNDKRRAQPWRTLRDGTIAGTLAKYYIRLAAYYLTNNGGQGGGRLVGISKNKWAGSKNRTRRDAPHRLHRARLLCPTVTGFDDAIYS